jgi:alpha-amylase
MNRKKIWSALSLCVWLLWLSVSPVFSTQQPTTIFHAFDQHYLDVEGFVCDLAEQGYSHIQIAPAQKSNPSDQWWARYQPVDYRLIEGKGSEGDLEKLVEKAHSCGIKVIADVVFNHMANLEEFRSLDFPGISAADFHPRCAINYADSDRSSEINC